MTLEELRRSKRDQILALANHYGARNVRVFGSLARGEHAASSDIDFLVLVDLDPERPAGLSAPGRSPAAA
jgi:predicted nucleotidyltransferase